MLAKMTSLLNANGIIPIFSFLNRMNASGDGLNAPTACALPLDDTIDALSGLQYAIFRENFPSSYWIEESADTYAAMIQSSILEGDLGLTLLYHVYEGCDRIWMII